MRFMIDLMLIQDNYHTNIIVIFLDKNIELAILHSYILFHFFGGKKLENTAVKLVIKLNKIKSWDTVCPRSSDPIFIVTY